MQRPWARFMPTTRSILSLMVKRFASPLMDNAGRAQVYFVGASLLAMAFNDDPPRLTQRGVLTSIASKPQAGARSYRENPYTLPIVQMLFQE